MDCGNGRLALLQRANLCILLKNVLAESLWKDRSSRHAEQLYQLFGFCCSNYYSVQIITQARPQLHDTYTSILYLKLQLYKNNIQHLKPTKANKLRVKVGVSDWSLATATQNHVSKRRLAKFSFHLIFNQKYCLALQSTAKYISSLYRSVLYF